MSAVNNLIVPNLVAVNTISVNSRLTFLSIWHPIRTRTLRHYHNFVHHTPDGTTP